MSLIGTNLPAAETPDRYQAYQWDAPADLLGKWAKVRPPASMANAAVIDIFDVIGEDFWGDGVSVAKVVAQLDGVSDVIVRINSPGGDVFEGMAIYEAFRRHEGRVEMQIFGLAASAASLLAMAGDEIVMGPASMMMVHNAWGMVIGNRQDLERSIAALEKIDAQMANTYAARTGGERDAIVAMMDEETFMTAEEAVEKGFAGRIDGDVETVAKLERVDADDVQARRRLEAALARDGVPRKERPGLISRALDIAPRDASDDQTAARDAGTITREQLLELQNILKR